MSNELALKIARFADHADDCALVLSMDRIGKPGWKPAECSCGLSALIAEASAEAPQA